MNDVTVFMSYNYMVRFKIDDKEYIWNKIRELNIDADMVAIDSDGYNYVGW